MNTQATVSNTGNPIIAPLLRAVYILIAVVVLAGASLFFVPGLMVPRWPWSLAPFNTSFLGTIYVVELVAVTIAVSSGLVNEACAGRAGRGRRPRGRLLRSSASRHGRRCRSGQAFVAGSSASIRAATSRATLPLPTTTARSWEESNSRSGSRGGRCTRRQTAVAGQLRPGESFAGDREGRSAPRRWIGRSAS